MIKLLLILALALTHVVGNAQEVVKSDYEKVIPINQIFVDKNQNSKVEDNELSEPSNDSFVKLSFSDFGSVGNMIDITIGLVAPNGEKAVNRKNFEDVKFVVHKQSKTKTSYYINDIFGDAIAMIICDNGTTTLLVLNLALIY